MFEERGAGGSRPGSMRCLWLEVKLVPCMRSFERELREFPLVGEEVVDVRMTCSGDCWLVIASCGACIWTLFSSTNEERLCVNSRSTGVSGGFVSETPRSFTSDAKVLLSPVSQSLYSRVFCGAQKALAESPVKSSKSWVSEGLEEALTARLADNDDRDGGRPLERFTGEMPSPRAGSLDVSSVSRTGVPVACSERELLRTVVELATERRG